MGAVFKADLRSDVTHMVVGSVTTPKYQVFCRHRVCLTFKFAAQNRFDLKIMDLNWIKDAYEKWIQGEDVDLPEVCISL
jgi:DNA replication regulator DPB11